MNQRKKVLIILVMVVIAMVLIRLISVNPTKTGITSSITGKNQGDNVGFYYGNLSTEEKNIYDGIKKMYTEGILRTGAEYELVGGGKATQDQISKYINGNNTLISQLEKAKKAFSADYPDTFYIDFSKLTIRVTSNGSNIYKAYLGAGNNENYFIAGITKDNVNTKINEYEEKIEQIVSNAQVIGTEASIDSGEALDIPSVAKLRVQYVYNTIINNASYKFEDNCTSGNEAYLRTPYGVLVMNEATPSGYARAIKVVLDRLDISCMVIEDETNTVEEINAYTELDGKWYKVNDLETALTSTPSVKENQNSISYLAKYTNYWKTFDKPSFIENTDVTITDKASGNKLSSNAKDKLMLISKEINESQTQAMTNKIESTINKKVLKSDTYDLKLMLGQTKIDSTNEKLRVSVKFPEGYDANTLGIEYKAYYFVENDAGGIASAVEIPCTVTPYGLIMECDHFSKMTVVAVNGNTSGNSEKVILSNTKGGTVLCDNKNIVELSSNESKSISIVPSSGYEIEKIFILGKETQKNENGSTEYVLNYNDLQNGNNIVYVSFIPQSVKANRTEETVSRIPTSAKITFAQVAITKQEGENVSISPTVITYGENYTCRWYKETEKLVGQTKEKLELSSITKEDAGRYRLIIITNLGASSVTTESAWVTLGVTDKAEPTPTEKVEPTPTDKPTPTPTEVITPTPTEPIPTETPTPTQSTPTPTISAKTPAATPKPTTNQGTNKNNTTKTPAPKPVLTPIATKTPTNNDFVLPVKTPQPRTQTPSPTSKVTSEQYKTDVLGSKAEEKKANKKSNHVATFIITVAILGAGVFVIKKKVIDPKNAE